MKDIFSQIRKAKEGRTLDNFVHRLKGDLNIDYELSYTPIGITEYANNTLENIYQLSIGKFTFPQADGYVKALAREVAFAGIINPKFNTITEFIIGEVGNESFCNWEAGNLKKYALRRANETGGKVVLGHAHPVIIPEDGEKRKYGAIPSFIPCTKEDLYHGKWDERIKERIKETETYKNYGWDFCEILANSQVYDEVSNISMIISPALNQKGIFEVQPEGRVIYHPMSIVAN